MIATSDQETLRTDVELFYFAYRAFTSRADHVLELRGLNRAHHRILYFVGCNPGITVNALLQLLKVSKQALNLPLRQLLEMNLLATQPPAHDRRMKPLVLTAEGRRLESQLTATQTRLLAKAFAQAGGDAVRQWRAVMRQLPQGD